MNENKTEIIVILDRSGSMGQGGKTEATISGFNEFLGDQRKLPGECLMTVCMFNTVYQITHNGVDIQAMPELSRKWYVPEGQTALLDAVARTITEVGARYAGMEEKDRPGNVVVAILTDGQENASVETELSDLKKMIERQTDEYSWKFVYIGAGVDAFNSGMQLGIDNAKPGNLILCSANSSGGVQRAMKGISRSVGSTRTKGTLDKSGTQAELDES
jgi:Mg-chelatase subunit ChlD